MHGDENKVKNFLHFFTHRLLLDLVSMHSNDCVSRNKIHFQDSTIVELLAFLSEVLLCQTH